MLHFNYFVQNFTCLIYKGEKSISCNCGVINKYIVQSWNIPIYWTLSFNSRFFSLRIHLFIQSAFNHQTGCIVPKVTSRWKLPNILWFKQTEKEEKRAQIKESEINATRSTKWANRIEHKNNGVNSKAAVNTKQVKSNLIIVFVCLCVCAVYTMSHRLPI